MTGHSDDDKQSDSDDDKQIDETEILQLQKEFAENDASSRSNHPFHNVFDKGYDELLGAFCDKGSSVFILKICK